MSISIEKEKLRTELITDTSVTTLSKILEFQNLLPKELKYNPMQVMTYLQNKSNIHMFLCNGYGEAIGYIFAQPHNDALKDLEQDDPLMQQDSDRYYIDQIVAARNGRRGVIFANLVYGVFREGNARGINKFSSHVLSHDGLNHIVNRLFRKYITTRRNVVLPSYGNELYTYFEATYKP